MSSLQMSQLRHQPSHDGYRQVGLHHPNQPEVIGDDGPPTTPGASPPEMPHPLRRAETSGSTVPLAGEGTSQSRRGTSSPARSSPGYDPERAQGVSGRHARPTDSRNSSWDLLAGIRKLEHSYEEFDTRKANQPHLAFADGDLPKNKFTKLYNYLINVSIVTRWIIFIVPILGILWIPGILSLTTFPNAKIWGIRLLWWSIWLTICWAGWWGALAISRTVPSILRSTIGVVAVTTRRYIDWMQALHRYIALFAWTLAIWVAWDPIIDVHQREDAGDKSIRAIDLCGKLLFALFLCAAVLLFEKFSIQWIAGKFHERSYAERISDQKFAVKSLVTLYRHSTDIPGRLDTLHDGPASRGASMMPKRLLKRIREGVRVAATTTTTAFGNVASEIAGSSVLQPNSPQAMVKTALESANKSRLLARRLFYSFAKPGSDYLLPGDIAPYFPDPEEAERVFSLFDKDMNGDATRDEVEMACLEFHREQLSIENSMRDLDSAVGRLDNILMSVYVIVAILIVAVALEAQLVTLVTGAGTLILGLSWLIGGSLQEVLTSIIFLFVKHPFDVGDRVIAAKETYTVKEIRLLSTILLDGSGILVQAPNTVLNTMFIQNIRRSPQLSEMFTFDVSYATTFEDLERLRENMLEFVKSHRRDYLPAFDVAVKDFPDQEKLTLTVDIKYRSNGQLAALKAKRRNKWICALKTALADVKIYGPKGNPDAPPPTTRYTKVPWETAQAQDRKSAAEHAHHHPEARAPLGGWELSDENAAMRDSNDVFGESDELYMTNPRADTIARDGMRQRPSAQVVATMPVAYIPSSSSGLAGHHPESFDPLK